MPAWDLSDLTLPEVASAANSGPERQLALTILYHPEPARIGEVALPGVAPGTSEILLSRRQPDFCAPRGPAQSRPLADRYLSRSPVRLCWRGEQLAIDAPASGSSFKVNGRACESTVSVSISELEQGVVLALASRVVLLLHRYQPEPTWPDDCGLVGEHPSIQQLRTLVSAVADRGTPVLLLGESGTGKELLARAIHARSTRSERALVAVNVAAIPEELAAAELFGVRRGAFTGADADRRGYFSQADGGTLFLDEIGACQPGIQPQLLRALQQGEIQVPGGGTQQVDVRILAATDDRLDGQFSKALRYRLGGVEINLPPLRERREDIGRLVRHFAYPTLLEGADDATAVSRWVEAMSRLALHDWPGNVRELANVCQQMDIASRGGSIQFPELSRPPSQPAARQESGSPPPSDQQVSDALMAARWEISKAARALQISRQALYRRMEAIPDLRTAADIPSAEITATFYECDGDLEQAALRLQVSRTALKRRWRAMDL